MAKAQPYIFTEVFDSINFPENGDISKYMTLETQLAKQKGICILTYGYSGTGKTYTLFGNGIKDGMLQSTLINISNLNKVEFRVFEIYGLGMAYDYYWNDKANKQSKINDIYHLIDHYELNKTGNIISVKSENNKPLMR